MLECVQEMARQALRGKHRGPCVTGGMPPTLHMFQDLNMVQRSSEEECGSRGHTWVRTFLSCSRVSPTRQSGVAGAAAAVGRRNG